MPKICKVCSQPVYSNLYCRFHQYLRTDEKYLKANHKAIQCFQSKKSLNYSSKKRSSLLRHAKPVKQQSKSNKKSWNHTFFQAWWLKVPSNCIECGRPLYYYSPMNIHHLVLKSKQKQYSIDITENEDNLVKACTECHGMAHTNIDHVPKIKRLTEIAKERFETYKTK